MSEIHAQSDNSFHELFEAFIRSMTDAEKLDLARIYNVLGQICVLLRVSKGVARFYESSAHESMGDGEEFVCFDSGEDSVLISEKRAVNPTGMVITCAVYQAKGAEPFTELERSRVELVQNSILSIISRSRLQLVVERMTFWDDEGYHNLRYFMSGLNHLRQTGRIAGKTAFRINLKHFALVNQQIGRIAADRAMRAYFEALNRAVGEEGLVGRLGGDNFVLLCQADCLEQTMECLQGCPVAIEHTGVHSQTAGAIVQDRIIISALAGGYAIPEDFTDCTYNDVMDKIMSAYQVAKAGKSGDIVFYSGDIVKEKERTIRVQQSFDQALKSEEFKVYYQPKVNIHTKELIGAEALCRWLHDGEIVPPSEFIPVLERGSDICRLDFYMLEHTCRDIRRWLDAGVPVVKISVNLSRRHMMDPDLLEHILGIVDRNNVPHEYIEIELTETTTDVEFKDLKRVVRGLQKVGIYTSVDDFGVGYSSLNLIKEIPWNVLKLDRSLLPDSEGVKRGNRMYRHIVSMAREIGLECVAEGVETPEQMRILEEYGCDVAQGFYFDRPLPVSDFEKRMQARGY